MLWYDQKFQSLTPMHKLVKIFNCKLAFLCTLQANDSERSEHEKLKQEARKMIIAGIEDPSKNLDLIDTIQRLGVSYHFEEEIKELLEKMHGNLDAFVKDNADHLHQISLCFRLLRQQGYKVSCGNMLLWSSLFF